MPGGPKQVKTMQIAEVRAVDVVPGMIIAQGVVLSVSTDDRGHVWMSTLDATVWAYGTGTVQVFAQISPEDAQTLAEAYGESEARES